jgi:negative regulator of flagellin synthesis FlgM
MRIEDKGNISNFENVKDVQKKDDVKKQQVSKQINKSEPKGDAISISSEAYDTAKKLDQLKEMPDVREEKVSALKKEVDSGTYNVAGKEVAEKIVNSAINGTF